MDRTAISTEKLHELIAAGDKKALLDIFVTVPTVDVAEPADGLEMKDLIILFRSVPSEHIAALLDALSQDVKTNLIKAMTDKELVTVINSQSADDVADAVGDMPANLACRVLQAAGKDMRNDVNRLLKYKDETAGAIMTTEYLQFLDSISADEAIESVRCIGRQAETIYTIFVRSADRRFVGTVDLDDLIFARKDQKLSEVMNKNAVSCRADTDQEEAAGMFKRYNLNALAVVNEDNCLIGIITIDDAIDVMEQEASEDIAKMNAVAPMDQPYLKTPIAKMANKCIPWIVILLVLGTFSSLILSSFQNTLAKYSVLAAFVPVLMDTAGNAGSQTCSIVVRSLGLKEYAARDYLKVLWREMLNSLIVASIVGLFCLLWIAVEQYTGIVTNPILYSAGQAETLWNGLCWNLPFFLETFKVSAIVSATIFFAIIVSKFVGLSLPVMAAALKKDPAFMSQPLLATVMDIVSLLIYFGIAIAVIPSIA